MLQHDFHSDGLPCILGSLKHDRFLQMNYSKPPLPTDCLLSPVAPSDFNSIEWALTSSRKRPASHLDDAFEHAPLAKYNRKEKSSTPFNSTSSKSCRRVQHWVVNTQMADDNTHTHILAIPLELRQMIFKDVLTNPSCGAQLLRTSKEIYQEAHKFLFQRPVLFHGQAELYSWLDRVPELILPQVTEIIIELYEVDLTTLLSQPSSSTQPTPELPRLRAWDLHEQELDKLNQNLLRLPNIQTLTIHALPDRQSFLYREFLTNFLSSLSTILPNLKSLVLSGNFHHQDLTFLTTLTTLQSFTFDGFSASSASNTATILSSLPNLTSLTLTSHHSTLAPPMHTHSTFTSKRQSFTSSFFLATHRLSSFSLSEYSTSHPASTPLFFTPDLLTHLVTHTNLLSLSIKLSHAPPAATLDALETYLISTSTLSRLELDWPDLTSDVLEEHVLVPSCVEEVWLRVAGGLAGVFDVLWGLLEGRESGDLEKLRRVVLMRGVGDKERDEEQDNDNDKPCDDIEEQRSHEEYRDRDRDGGKQIKDEEEDKETLFIPSVSETSQAPATESDPSQKPLGQPEDAEAETEVEVKEEEAETEAETESSDHIDSEPFPTDTDTTNISRVIRRLNTLGIRVLWSTDGMGYGVALHSIALHNTM